MISKRIHLSSSQNEFTTKKISIQLIKKAKINQQNQIVKSNQPVKHAIAYIATSQHDMASSHLYFHTFGRLQEASRRLQEGFKGAWRGLQAVEIVDTWGVFTPGCVVVSWFEFSFRFLDRSCDLILTCLVAWRFGHVFDAWVEFLSEL